jgi:type I restriction enzyme S subunit
MELKEGYRQTEIGVIPDDWTLESVGCHFEFKNGLNKAKEFFGHGTPIINYMDVFSHPGLKREHVRGLVSLSSDEQRNYSAKKGDVFFTRTSETLEEVGMSSVLLDDINDASFSGFVLRARQKGDRFAQRFCQFCFRA